MSSTVPSSVPSCQLRFCLRCAISKEMVATKFNKLPSLMEVMAELRRPQPTCCSAPWTSCNVHAIVRSRRGQYREISFDHGLNHSCFYLVWGVGVWANLGSIFFLTASRTRWTLIEFLLWQIPHTFQQLSRVGYVFKLPRKLARWTLRWWNLQITIVESAMIISRR